METPNATSVVEKPLIDRDVPEEKPSYMVGPATKPIEKLLKQLGPKSIFGEAVKTEATTVIPVAELRMGFGFGSGQGRSTKPARKDTLEEGGGAGGGAGARMIPRGYIHIVGAKVRYVPIRDGTRLAFAGMMLTAWLAFVFSKAFPRSPR